MNKPSLKRILCAASFGETCKVKLLDQVLQAIRAQHYSISMEEAYVNWIKRFIQMNDKSLESPIKKCLYVAIIKSLYIGNIINN